MISSISGSQSGYPTLAASTRQTAATGAAQNDNPLKKLIAEADSDGDGALSVDELKTALSSDDTDGSVDIDQLFSLLDSDAGGTVSESELAAALGPPPAAGRRRQRAGWRAGRRVDAVAARQRRQRRPGPR